MTMSSRKPYFLRAILDWIVDNNCTPLIAVNTLAKGVSVPQEYVNSDGEIILNIAPSAVHQFVMDKHVLSFSARFGGVSQPVEVPLSAILRMYARENGMGMAFESENEPEPPPDKPDSGKRPSLRVIK